MYIHVIYSYIPHTSIIIIRNYTYICIIIRNYTCTHIHVHVYIRAHANYRYMYIAINVDSPQYVHWLFANAKCSACSTLCTYMYMSLIASLCLRSCKCLEYLFLCVHVRVCELEALGCVGRVG